MPKTLLASARSSGLRNSAAGSDACRVGERERERERLELELGGVGEGARREPRRDESHFGRPSSAALRFSSGLVRCASGKLWRMPTTSLRRGEPASPAGVERSAIALERVRPLAMLLSHRQLCVCVMRPCSTQQELLAGTSLLHSGRSKEL